MLAAKEYDKLEENGYIREYDEEGIEFVLREEYDATGIDEVTEDNYNIESRNFEFWERYSEGSTNIEGKDVYQTFINLWIDGEESDVTLSCVMKIVDGEILGSYIDFIHVM